MSEQRLPFTTHLEELRRRLINIFLAIGVGFLLAYGFKEKIFDFLAIPLIASLPDQNSWMVFTGVGEAFFTYLKLSFLAGVFFALPVIFYQIYAFVAPGLYLREKRVVVPFVFFATLFFVMGAAFGYFVVFPFGFRYFMSFATDFIRPMPSLREYLSFATSFLLAFGAIFELPLVIYFLAKIGLVKPQMLTKHRGVSVVIIFIVAAILTPPDVVSQLMMAFPLLVLYEISIVVARVVARGRAARARQGEDEEKLRNPAG